MALIPSQRSLELQPAHRWQAGVTLIEMIVVVAIIGVVSAVLLFNYSDFSTNVSVRNLSQEIALSVRKAQTYATSVRPIDGTQLQSSSTFPGYGISFSTDTSTSNKILASNKQFVLFADIPIGDKVDARYGPDYDQTCGAPSNASNECIETFGITSSDRIVAICTGTDGSYSTVSVPLPKDCKGSGTVNITFKRPSPDATIMYNNTRADYVQIVVQSAKGLQRGILVWNTGQVSVQ